MTAIKSYIQLFRRSLLSVLLFLVFASRIAASVQDQATLSAAADSTRGKTEKPKPKRRASSMPVK